jgi:hypothetical protein
MSLEVEISEANKIALSVGKLSEGGAECWMPSSGGGSYTLIHPDGRRAHMTGPTIVMGAHHVNMVKMKGVYWVKLRLPSLKEARRPRLVAPTLVAPTFDMVRFSPQFSRSILMKGRLE